MKKLPLILAALAATLVSASAPAAGPGPAVHVMRHLNTPEGERDPDLTPEGAAAAQRLVGWFANKPLAAIYVSDFKRTRQTAAPLAAARGLTPRLYDPSDTPGLIARVREEMGPVLIVGHSNTVPGLVEALGGERPGDLAHKDFGDIFTVDGKAVTKARLDSN